MIQKTEFSQDTTNRQSLKTQDQKNSVKKYDQIPSRNPNPRPPSQSHIVTLNISKLLLFSYKIDFFIQFF
jgi:hypothetical protein